jgi:predicted nucleic acid-binding protein
VILVDTSVWITAINQRGSPEARELDEILGRYDVASTDVVIAELLQGAKSDQEFARLSAQIDGLTFFHANEATWRRAAELAYQLKRQGLTTALSDLLVAAVALENDLPVYATDTDFKRVPGLKLHEV